MKLRIKFRKYGAVCYIGHLDIMRFFQKAIRRAEIDIVYSSGFSPHQIMSFAAPLGVGLESNGEYMDIEVNSITSSQDMLYRLNQASVEGIEVTEVHRLPDKAGNAMASVAAAAYSIGFRKEKMESITVIDTMKIKEEPLENLEAAVSRFLSKPEILITKETKKGTHVIDLKLGIYKMSVKGEKIYLLVDASSAGNIKPSLVIETLFAEYGKTLPENSLLITREETYTNIGTEEKKKFIPLGAVGESF